MLNKTITLSETETEVAFEQPSYFYFVYNMSDEICYVSLKPSITPGSDGVIAVPPGCSFGISDNRQVSKIYAVGNGDVQICGKNTDINPFKMPLKGGGNTINVDNVKINLYSQENAPTTYDGFWIDTASNVAKIAQVEDFLSQWNDNFISKLGISIGSAGIAIVGTKAYIIGGLVDGVAVSTVFIYDFLTNKISQGTDMPVAKRSFACGSHNGKIYCAGGSSATATAAQNSLLIYDTDNNSWSYGANMPSARSLLSGFIADGKLFCCGGWNTSGSPQTSVYVYDILLLAWSTGTSMPAARMNGSAVAYNGFGYYMGGAGTSSSSVYNTNYILNISSSTWSTGTAIPSARYNSGIIYYNGNIHLIGGNTTNAVAVATNFMYNISNTVWDTDTAMPSANAPLLALYNDVIYCFGNNDNNYIYLPDGVQTQLYDSDTLIIQAMPVTSNQPYKTMLLESTSFIGGYLQYFTDLMVNNLNADIYYGDGTQWVKIRSAA